MRYLLIGLALLLAGLNYQLWLNDQAGVREWRALQARVDRQQAENARLTERNDALTAEVDSLKNGDEAIEERARTEMGMIRDDETFFYIIEPVSDR